MKVLFIGALLLSGFFSLGQVHSYQVEFLNDRYDKTKFLNSATDLHQAVRYYEDSVMVASGWRSKAHLSAIDSLNEIDSILVGQIDQYLDLYGFPDKTEYDERPRIASWLIIHHSDNIELKRKHFPAFYKAYKNENLEERRLLQYLEEQYVLEKRKNFQSYAVEEARIAELMQALELMPGRGRKLLRMQ